MKLSLYNNLIPLTDKYGLLYNALTDQSILLPVKCKDALLREEFACLEERYPSFYKQLVAAGGVVEDACDEIKILQERIDSAKNNVSEYHLIVNPTLYCNFKCWYCYESHDQKSKMEKDTLQRVLAHIGEVLRRPEIKVFKLSFFGGEPLLYYDDVVIPLIRYLVETSKQNQVIPHIYFTSNAYLLNEEKIESLASYGVDSFQITLDGNKEQHNRIRYPSKGKDSYDKIVAHIKGLIKKQIHVILRINYTKDNVLTLKDILRDFSDMTEADQKYLSVDMQKVWQDDVSQLENAEAHLEDVITAFRQQHFIVSHKVFDMVKDPCYADKKNEYLINYDGSVYKCTARDFKTENRLGYLREDGTVCLEKPVVWDNRLKEICCRCRIAPLCGGGCFQRRSESGPDECTYDYTEEVKNEIILNRFYDMQVKDYAYEDR